MTVDRRAFPARAGVLLVFALLAVASLVPLWRAPGWPINHDNAFGLRTEVYARHFAELDLLPVWSSADVHGFGSPMPLMYHKLFFMAAGLVSLTGTSIKTADVATLWLFLMIGAVGIYRTARQIGSSRLAAALGGCALVTANYTIVNWLVRGALAEFSAAMIIPWVLLFLVRSLQANRLQPGLGGTLGLLWLAHSALAFYVGLLLAVTGLMMVITGAVGRSVLRPSTWLVPLAWFALLVGPYLAMMMVLSRGYDFTRILIPYRPQNEFRPPLDYLWEQHWRFGRTMSGLTVQLDHAILGLLVVSLGALLMRRPARTPDRPPSLMPGSRRLTLHAVLPFLILAGLGLLLQLPASALFYEWMPGAAYLQFPWRLLALITPCLIVPAVSLADTALPSDLRLFGLGATTAWMVAASGAFAPLQDPRFPIDPPQMAGFTFSSPYREYEPRTAPPVADIEAALAARWRDSGCSYQRAGDHAETTTVRFATVCERPATLPLPIYASRLHLVNTPNSRRRPCLAVSGFPDLCGAVIPAGPGQVLIEIPRITSVPGWLWQQRRRG